MKHARPDYNRIQDPLGLIPEDEPVFLLRGKDILTPTALEAWIAAAETANELGYVERTNGDPVNVEKPIPLHTLAQARQQLTAIKLYQRDHGAKVPDSPDQVNAKADKSVDVKVQVGSKALAKIINRAQKDGAEIVDASGLLTALAERAKAEIGAIMIAHNHATLSYERLEDGTFAMVGRVFDQKIVVRLSDDPDDGGKVIPINPKTKNPWPGDADEFRDGRPQAPHEEQGWSPYDGDPDEGLDSQGRFPADAGNVANGDEGGDDEG